MICDLLQHKEVIVCCGAGGVGKTTVAASLAVAAAQLGQKVLVLTIDPSRRLAELLGVSHSPVDPIPIAGAKLNSLQIAAPGALDVWVLNPMQVANSTVKRAINDDLLREDFLNNPIYQQVSMMAAGMQEYTAMKALHGFLEQKRYQLIVLDTPPSRHALDFLDAPSRLAQFLEESIFHVFIPKATDFVHQAARAVAVKAIKLVGGNSFAGDLISFLSNFASIFNKLGAEVSATRKYLSQSTASFLLVTSPAAESLREAFFFQDRVHELSLPFGGYILNRSCVHMADWAFPDRNVFANTALANIDDDLLQRVQQIARLDQEMAKQHTEILQQLRQRAGHDVIVKELPILREVENELSGIAELARMVIR